MPLTPSPHTNPLPLAPPPEQVTLLSPDHPLDDFLATSYPLLCALGVPLTIYGDRHDKPLTYSELVSGERTLGKVANAP